MLCSSCEWIGWETGWGDDSTHLGPPKRGSLDTFESILTKLMCVVGSWIAAEMRSRSGPGPVTSGAGAIGASLLWELVPIGKVEFEPGILKAVTHLSLS